MKLAWPSTRELQATSELSLLVLLSEESAAKGAGVAAAAAAAILVVGLISELEEAEARAKRWDWPRRQRGVLAGFHDCDLGDGDGGVSALARRVGGSALALTTNNAQSGGGCNKGYLGPVGTFAFEFHGPFRHGWGNGMRLDSVTDAMSRADSAGAGALEMAGDSGGIEVVLQGANSGLATPQR
eukprot:jgi/Tetstr1/420896/TSEL_011959.t1